MPESELKNGGTNSQRKWDQQTGNLADDINKQPKEDGSLVRNTLFLSVRFQIPKSLNVSSPNWSLRLNHAGW